MTVLLASPAKLHEPIVLPGYEQLLHRARTLYHPHPFAAEMSKDRLASLLPDYFAMSEAFPLLQAGSQKDLAFHAIDHNQGIPRDVELTSVVANFISWDETGGHRLVLRGGNAALPQILDTTKFHSKLFAKDVSRLLGRAIEPNYSAITRQYLRGLYSGLSSRDPILRSAAMVAFELHAGEMIQALWTTVADTFDARVDELEYFRLHVGGEDPAEKRHGEMTSRLIAELIPADSVGRFLDEFDRAYGLNVEWCRGLAGTRSLERIRRPEVEHRGRCHCGSVRFCVQAPADISAVSCNCSICQMSGFLHMLVPRDKLRIECGEELLSTYQFNQNIARHTFCQVCGVKPFYRPRSNPSGFSVNVRCLDATTIECLRIDEFDGKNWERAIPSLQVDRSCCH
ncbi:GFA family protein [Bradyrhizobium sp. Tv2a-2]|uniref:GFA family protein n=1 Tax=Bradyrhizobium sp. Tv2a-2 TaxID=113395 RepID=UPI000401A2EC|nr:GFA family protein [Bradyrhizobium sp. Tv2a-2]